MRILSLKRIRDHDGWLMSSCPFAKWTHSKGVDNRPSFGISIGGSSFFHCFSCGEKGRLVLLPTRLSWYSHEDSEEARSHIMSYEGKGTDKGYDHDDFNLGIAPIISEKNFQKYPSAKSIINIEPNVCGALDLKYDRSEDRVLFPIRDMNGRLIGIRGRYCGKDKNMPKYREYGDKSHRGVKSYGIWYGMNETLNRKKLLVLVEGERDRLELVSSKLITNVWASMGATLTETQIQTVRDTGMSVMLFFDNDKAGKLASLVMEKNLKGLVPLYKVTNYFKCKDPAELAQQKLLAESLKSIIKL